MDILKRDYYNKIFNFYEKLLTQKQINYFKDYYFYDLSLKEIAENYHVTRNAVFDQVKKTIKLLDEYEEKLQLYRKAQDIIELIGEPSLEEKIKKILQE